MKVLDGRRGIGNRRSKGKPVAVRIVGEASSLCPWLKRTKRNLSVEKLSYLTFGEQYGLARLFKQFFHVFLFHRAYDFRYPRDDCFRYP